MIERNYIKELFKDIPAAIFLSIEIYGFCIMIRWSMLALYHKN